MFCGDIDFWLVTKWFEPTGADTATDVDDMFDAFDDGVAEFAADEGEILRKLSWLVNGGVQLLVKDGFLVVNGVPLSVKDDFLVEVLVDICTACLKFLKVKRI